MIERAVERLHARLGGAYRHAFFVTEGLAAVFVAAVSAPLLMSYYRVSAGQVLVAVGVGVLSTGLAVGYALRAGTPLLEPVLAWQAMAEPGPAATIAAWDGATNFSMRSFRLNAISVNAIAAAPLIATIALELHLPAGDLPVLVLAAIVPSAFATVLNYAISETLVRPWVKDIARALPAEFPFTANGLLLSKRLTLVLPVFTSFVGLLVAALVSAHGGSAALLGNLAAAVAVGLALSTLLTALLTRSVTAPIAELRRGLALVRGGDYTSRVPVLTSDELGELSHDFNLMAAGLAERRQIRDALEAYHDPSIIPFMLDGDFPRQGVALVATLMFVDAREFTAFSEQAEPPEVVAALNTLFELVVPIVQRHGGHVASFLGDGLLAAFGPPEGYIDHADRAIAAGAALVEAVNRPGARLPVGVGLNTGTVVAGAIGGAGRLNFSVIGDAVNVAARVESATRETGDELLLTRATLDAAVRPPAVVSRGTVALKGKRAPVEVLALLSGATRVGTAAAPDRTNPTPGPEPRRAAPSSPIRR